MIENVDEEVGFTVSHPKIYSDYSSKKYRM